MARALTATAIDAAKPGKVRREISDGGQEGLFLILQPTGAKSWALRYRSQGRPVKLTLGRWPAMTLARARAAAAEALEAARAGDDPAQRKREERALRHTSEVSERDRVASLVELFDKRHLSQLRTRATVRRELDRFVVAKWGDRNVQDIAKRDVIDLLDEIVDSGRAVSANRVRAYLSKFFGWCIERDILPSSPVTGIKPVVREKSRDRVLSDNEVRWFWAACEELGFPWGPLGQMLLLTGQRLGEVVGISDAEIEGDLWRLGEARTKNGRAHDVPLSAAARSVLSGMLRIQSSEGLYFTTTGRTPLSGFDKGRRVIAEKMEEIASKEAGEPVTIPHWTFHDLRRTAATGLARLGIPVRVTESVLNHVSGTASGIVSVYQRHDYAEEKRVALDAWGRFVSELTAGADQNVIELEFSAARRKKI